VLNPEQPIANVTGKNTQFTIEMRVERGIGYMPREALQEGKVDIGTIALDAVFTPVRRVNYEVENMRVGDRTDFNRLRIFVETDGTLLPREALSRAVEIMIQQLKAVVGFKEEMEEAVDDSMRAPGMLEAPKPRIHAEDSESMKTRIDTLNLSARTQNALNIAGIRTVGGLARKREEDILSIEGLGAKGLQEIRRALSNFGITLK
jgi:DNA-directed RNA polymerase subunit alpha